MVNHEPTYEIPIATFKAQGETCTDGNDEVENGQPNFKWDQRGHVSHSRFRILSDFNFLKIIYAHIKQNIEQKSKVEHGIVEAIFLRSDRVLNSDFNAKNVKWFDKKVQ